MRSQFAPFSLVALLFFSFASSFANAQEFSSAVFDLGMVVSDIDKSMDFYTKAVGLKEVPGFSVSGEWTGKAGLTDGKKLDIRMLVLGKGEEGAATPKLKLMQVAGAAAEKPKNEFVHSSLGFSYITIHVKDMNVTLERLKKANVATIADTPIPLPAPLPSSIFITLVRDPDGNFVEFVGPKP